MDRCREKLCLFLGFLSDILSSACLKCCVKLASESNSVSKENWIENYVLCSYCRVLHVDSSNEVNCSVATRRLLKVLFQPVLGCMVHVDYKTKSLLTG